MCTCSCIARKASTIHFGCMKCETHAWVFSQTLVNGNRKNEIRQRNRKKVKKRGLRMGRGKAGTKEKRSPDGLNYSSGLPSPRGLYARGSDDASYNLKFVNLGSSWSLWQNFRNWISAFSLVYTLNFFQLPK